uniref:Uncharacterized protein n=1 Tax=Arundo donax TaxID=35708 RepID=A0A0A9D524_ARUDO
MQPTNNFITVESFCMHITVVSQKKLVVQLHTSIFSIHTTKPVDVARYS